MALKRRQSLGGGLVEETLRFAVPTLFTLVAEPAFLAADSIIVGHLGVAQLAALGAAAAILTLVTSSFIVLAYGTTARVSRLVGEGRHAEAAKLGNSALVAGAIIGTVVAVVLAVFGRWLLTFFSVPAAAFPFARTYLEISLFGVPFQLMSLGGLGTMRGLGDAKGPLYVQVAGYLLNIVLNFSLVYGVGMGIAGSALGTVVSQALVAAGYLWLVALAHRRTGGTRFADFASVVEVFSAGGPLIVRTAALRVAILLAIWVAEGQGTVALAAFSASMTIWMVLAFLLDAVAIAAQTSFARSLGAGELEEARRATGVFVRLSIVFGLATGAVVMVTAGILPAAFTTDPATRSTMTELLRIVAVLQPVASLVFMLDGILIGLGEFGYLAWASLASLAAFLPAALSVHFALDTPANLWIAFGILTLARAATLSARIARRDWSSA
ncbi:MAG: MATE family efflux transporter [Actinobacteria bacterium]|nr:MATE family efflux transporter [Actinomycetota bacterium]MDA8374181.1 MATE family efflux transporter [Actinomycetota bacterium]